jgi:hypothetical protein
MGKNKMRKKPLAKKLSLGLIIVLLLIIILAPLLKKSKILEGNTSEEESQKFNEKLSQTMQDIDSTNMQIKNLINIQNEPNDKLMDTNTLNARLEHTKLENKSNKMQIILLTIVAIIIIISIMLIYSSA